MRVAGFILSLFLLLSMLSCSHRPSFPEIHFTPGQYRVNSGDTLYSIAWRFNVDSEQLAVWNNIQPPFTIYPGQLLYLNEPRRLARHDQNTPDPERVEPAKPTQPPPQIAKAEPAPAPAKATPIPAPSPRPATPTPDPIAEPVPPPVKKPAPPPPPKTSNSTWQWPLQGKVVRYFSDKTSGKRGIEIKGKPGQSVIAARKGLVAYSGNGLKGYGELVILTHGGGLLTAYGQNSKRLVKEGETVQAGQRIAELGNGQALLHFEVRKNGSPVDPMRYLPK